MTDLIASSSEYTERSATKYKVACEVTEGREVSRDTHVREQRGFNHEE
jgi:hypothetical protein